MNDLKPCPYCGEQVLAVAVKCKHCGSTIGGPEYAVKRQFAVRRALLLPALLILALFAVGITHNLYQTGNILGHGYSRADAMAIAQTIRDEYSKQPGVTVEDVAMIRESSTRMRGFAKIKIGRREANKSCTATLGEDGQSVWTCE